VKPATITARQQDFINLASAALATIMIGISGFALYAKNLIAAQCGFLAAVLWIVLSVHLFHRYRLQKKKTMGILTPILLVAAILTTFGTILIAGPLIGVSK
jgi:uncharacterized membrane protein